jgi:hypothetical protein
VHAPAWATVPAAKRAAPEGVEDLHRREFEQQGRLLNRALEALVAHSRGGELGRRYALH